MNEMRDQIPPAPRHGRWRRRRRRLLLALLAVLLAVGLGSMALVGTQIRVPDWVRVKLVERLNASTPDLHISLGSAGLVMQEGWKPRLLLRDVQIDDAAGVPLVNFSDLTGTFALGPLLRGELQPASISLSGARITLQRLADGTIGLSLGHFGQQVDRARSIAALIGDMDAFLTTPQMSALRRIGIENLSIEFEDLRAQQAWTVDGGQMEMTRDGDLVKIRGDFAVLGGRDYATTLTMNYSGRLGSTAADLGLSFQDMAAGDIAGQSPAMAWLAALRAPISGAVRVSVENDGTLGPLNATLQIGAGVLQPTDATDPIAFSSARSYFTYDPQTQTMEVDELSLVSNWVSASATGRTKLIDVRNGIPRELLSQMKITRIIANPMQLYPEPIELEGASMDIRLQMTPFVLTLGQLSLTDAIGTLRLRGKAEAAPEGWRLAVDGHLNTMTPERLMQIWPEGVVPRTRKWVSENVSRARLSNIQAALRLEPTAKPDLFLGFDFEDLTARFMKHMPPMQKVRGHASLMRSRFAVTAEAGHVVAPEGGALDITGTSFVVPDVRIKPSPAQVLLRGEGTITSALSLLDQEPLRAMQKADRPVRLAEGRAELSGKIMFPLRKKPPRSDIRFDVSGVLSNLRSDVIVPGRVISAKRLEVRARDDSLVLNGPGQIGTVPVTAEFRTGLGAASDGTSRVKGQIELSPRFVDEFRIGLPPGSVSGQGQAAYQIDLAKGAPGRFSLSSDLAGVGLRLSALNWRLSEPAKGRLTVAGKLGSPPAIDTVSLKAGGLTAQGAISLTPAGSLDRASFSRVQMAGWLDAPVTLIGRGAGRTPAVRVGGGGRIDMRKSTLGGGGDGAGGQGGPITLALDLLQISDGIALQDFRADLNSSGGLGGTFTGKVNGGARVKGQVTPQGARSAFRIQSENAGAVMVSAGFLQNARDGKLDLRLTPASGAGHYDGRLGIDDFRIRDVPSMAALMNAVSVIGLLEQLEGEGLHFNRVDARFHLSPQRVTLLEGSAVGASLGISMDGYYYIASKQMDLQGVFSPIYLVNAIGGIFTRRGEGLFGFTYTMKGPASKPEVSVNPLSAFTPAMFREIFRRAPPKVTRDAGTVGAAQVSPPAEAQTPPPDKTTPPAAKTGGVQDR